MHLTFVSIYTPVRSTGWHFWLVFAIQGTSVGLAARCPLERHAIWHRHLEHVFAKRSIRYKKKKKNRIVLACRFNLIKDRNFLPAILCSHFTGIRIKDSIAAAGWLGTAPTRFTTMPRGLTVLLVRTHNALSGRKRRIKTVSIDHLS